MDISKNPEEVLDNLLKLIDTICNEEIVDESTKNNMLIRFRTGVRLLLKNKLPMITEAFIIDNYSEECKANFAEEDTSILDKWKDEKKISLAGEFNGIEVIYINLYFDTLSFTREGRITEKNEEIALSLYAILDDEEQQHCLDEYPMGFGQYRADHSALGYILMYNLILKKVELIKRLLIKKRISEAFIIHISMMKFVMAYSYITTNFFFGESENTVVQRIQDELVEAGNSIQNWYEEAEKTIREKNLDIGELKIKVIESNKVIQELSSKIPEEIEEENRFFKKIMKLGKLISDINEIRGRRKLSKIFDINVISKNYHKLCLATSEMEWTNFILGLYNIFYDGTGQGEHILDNFKMKNPDKNSKYKMVFPPDFIIMEIKHLRTEPVHGKTANEDKISKIYLNHTNKDHFSLLEEKEIHEFQNKIIDRLLEFLEKLKQVN